MRADRLDACRLHLGQRERHGGVWYGGKYRLKGRTWDLDELNRGRVGLMRRIQPAIYCALPKSRLGSRIRLRVAHQYMVS